jgi:hypothetical protein
MPHGLGATWHKFSLGAMWHNLDVMWPKLTVPLVINRLLSFRLNLGVT